MYALEYDRYPARLEDLTIPDATGEPFMKRIPLDAWERPYLYGLREDGLPIVECLGADGLPGGEGESADVNSETLGLLDESGR